MSSKDGWIYCMSNASMPGVYKVGMTVRTPAERLAEANTSDTWRPPTEYKLEYSVPVADVTNTERIIHIQMEEYGYRIHPRREFFKAPLGTIKKMFDSVRSKKPAEIPHIIVIDSDSEEEVYIHPSCRPKKAVEPPGAATRKHLRSGRLI